MEETLNSITLLALSVVSYIIVRKEDLVSPAKVFVFIWLAQVLLIALPLRGALYIEDSGLYYIVAATICFGLGAQFSKLMPIVPFHKNEVQCVQIQESLHVRIVVCLFIMAMVQPVFSLISQGFSLRVLLNFADLLNMNTEMSVARYSERLQTTVFEQLMLVFTYFAPLWGGFIRQFIQQKKLTYLMLLPGIFVALTQGVKMCLITSIMLYIAGLIIASLVFKKKVRVTLKSLTLIVLGVVGLVALLMVSMMFRIGSFDLSTFDEVKTKFATYALGHISAFTQWYDTYDDLAMEHYFGAVNFAGLSSKVGLYKRELGLFQEMIPVSADGATNVYTVFRVLIIDYSIAGSLVYLFLVGVISNFCYRLVQKRQAFKSTFSIVLLACSYFTILWSFCTSIYVYASYIVVFFIFYFFVKILIVSHVSFHSKRIS